MIPRNPKNERVKRQYADFLRHADGKAEATIRQIEMAIQRYEKFTRLADFGTFDQLKARAFKTDLAGHGLSKATIFSTVIALKRFFGWLAMQPGYKSRIAPTDIEYLSLSDKDIRAAKAPANRAIPTLEQVNHVIERMDSQTPIEKRNRALLAFVALTGVRDGAVVSLRLKHIDLNGNPPRVIQNPNEVATKNSKRIDTFFFPIGGPFAAIVLEWIEFLRTNQLFGNDEPLFPKTAMAHDSDDCFTPVGLSREFWANAEPVREIFRNAFESAGLPSYSPHSFRHMLIQIAYQRKLTVPAMKAWSQNLGHEGMLTTLTSYGTVPLEQQRALIAESAPMTLEDDEMADALQIVRLMRAQRGLKS
jgi:integrase